MQLLRIILVLTIILAFLSPSPTWGQGTSAYTTEFSTAITYQNVGTSTANIQFQFYNQSGTLIASHAPTLAAGAGTSLSVEGLFTNFTGGTTMSANQDVIATIVQIPKSGSPLKSRPIVNAMRAGSNQVLLASVLKNKFNATSKFAVQNVASYNVDLTVKVYDITNPTSPITINRSNVVPGAAIHFDMGTLSEISASSFEGSAVVGAVKSSTAYAAPIVGAVLELSTSTTRHTAIAFEGMSRGFAKLFMATALCKAFVSNNVGSTTSYAVQNVSTTGSATVIVKYSNNLQESQTINAGAKKSFNACTVNASGFTGAATITSTGGDIIAVGKVFKETTTNTTPPPFSTAFMGEGYGAAKLALPYVRWTSNANYVLGQRQRTFIAIQNVGANTISNVTVKYLNKNGTVVGTHTIASIASNAKANSTPVDAGSSTALVEFGTPDSNPNGGFGGAALVEGAGELIAVARVTTQDNSLSPASDAAEDYNGIKLP